MSMKGKFWKKGEVEKFKENTGVSMSHVLEQNSKLMAEMRVMKKDEEMRDKDVSSQAPVDVGEVNPEIALRQDKEDVIKEVDLLGAIYLEVQKISSYIAEHTSSLPLKKKVRKEQAPHLSSQSETEESS